VLQCVAVCCSVLQSVAVCCGVLQCVAVRCSVLQCVAVCCSVLQCVAASCSMLQCVAACCSVEFFCIPTVTLCLFVCMNRHLQGGEHLLDALSCGSFSTKELRVIFHKRAKNYRELLQTKTYIHKASNGFSSSSTLKCTQNSKCS